ALAAADVRHVVAADALALGLDLDGVEALRDALELRVADQDLLVARPLDLEAPTGEAEGGDVDEVVALVAGERDRVSTVLVGARRSGDVARQRRDGDRGAFDRNAVRTDDAAANDVGLRRCQWRMECDRTDDRQCDDDAASETHGETRAEVRWEQPGEFQRPPAQHPSPARGLSLTQATAGFTGGWPRIASLDSRG